MVRRSVRRKMPGRTLEIAIAGLGGQGDGLTQVGDTTLYVPFTLPGDRVRVRTTGRQGDGERAEVVEWLDPAPRAEPPCRHFGTCGGCRLQHLDQAAYRTFKENEVRTALGRRGLAQLPVRPLLTTPPGARRRLRLAFEGQGRNLRLGLRTARSNRVVDLRECPIAAPAMVAAFAPLRAMLQDWRTGPGEVGLTASETGLDLLLIRPKALALREREALAALVDEIDLARITWSPDPAAAPEPVVVRRPVQVTLGGVRVDLPPAAFLQASAAAEHLLAALVGEAVGRPRSVVDLFAGCGTFGLGLAAAGANLHALEADGAMLQALTAAARRAGLHDRVAVSERDLMRNPLEPAALAGFDAAVLDPPRAGASAQAAALAASTVPRIAMVSCNPRTFARDARTLADGGYALAWVQPVDAFLWSPEIEVVGAFTRS